jgi:hypothetical protein
MSNPRKFKAIPTLYDGVQFRSRLEARWYAFFKLAGLAPEYEPFDLDGWIPDIVIPSKTYDGAPLLVEVKPLEHDDERVHYKSPRI